MANEIKPTEIWPEYISLDGHGSKSFNAEIYTEQGCYFLECVAEADYVTHTVYEGRGMEPEVLENEKIEVVCGHFCDEMSETTDVIETKELQEILESKITLER